MKHMKEVAKMLGVELNENFKVKRYSGETGPYALDNNRLYYVGNKRSDPKMLQELLNGELEIVKLPFKPKDGEPYWFWCSPIGGGGEVSKVYCRFGGDSLMCRECYMLGNCYRTEQECLADTAMADKIKRMERCKW